jgi:hypothetical protein
MMMRRNSPHRIQRAHRKDGQVAEDMEAEGKIYHKGHREQPERKG